MLKRIQKHKVVWLKEELKVRHLQPKEIITAEGVFLSLTNWFQALADLEDGSLEDKWERVKSTFTESLWEKLEFRKRGFNSWLSEETSKKNVERRNETELVDRLAEEAEDPAQRNDMKTFYNIAG